MKHAQVELHVNNMDVRFPHQLFINNEFIDSNTKREYATINPADESVICHVAKGSANDVDKAVKAAKVQITEFNINQSFPRRPSRTNGAQCRRVIAARSCIN